LGAQDEHGVSARPTFNGNNVRKLNMTWAEKNRDGTLREAFENEKKENNHSLHVKVGVRTHVGFGLCDRSGGLLFDTD
jgi:hypothetical protein